MNPIRTFHLIVPAGVIERVMAGEDVTLTRKNKAFYLGDIAVEARPMIARPPNWREMKKQKNAKP